MAQLIPFSNASELATGCATAFLAAAPSNHTVALSGGRIAKDFFNSVAQLAHARGPALAHLHFFWADERCVPPTDAESNYRSAAELLLTPLGIAPANIHRICGEAEPDRAAEAAAQALRHCTATDAAGQPVLDLVLLGMGEDGHIASLFPGEPANVVGSPAAYRAVTATKPPPKRITLGYGAITAAREIWILASGAGKEAALRESLAPDGQTPLARVLRARPDARIFTDLPF